MSEDYTPQHPHSFTEDSQAGFENPVQQAGNNIQAVIANLEKRMKEAARLRDELQKLRASALHNRINADWELFTASMQQKLKEAGKDYKGTSMRYSASQLTHGNRKTT